MSTQMTRPIPLKTEARIKVSTIVKAPDLARLTLTLGEAQAQKAAKVTLAMRAANRKVPLFRHL